MKRIEQTRGLRKYSAIVATVGVLVAALALSPPAEADHAGGAGSGILNSKQQRLCNNGFPKGQDAVDRGAQIITNNTPVNMYAVNCATGNSNVTVTSTGYPDNWFGQTSCSDWGSRPGYCIYKYVQLNGRTINEVNEFVQWNKSSIHELGHVDGLGHRYTNASAMKQGEAPPIATSFDGHDFDAIQNTYDY